MKKQNAKVNLALLDEDFKEVSTLKDAGWVMLENTPFMQQVGAKC